MNPTGVMRRGGKGSVRHRRHKALTPESIAELLLDHCQRAGIVRLEVFGSTARGKMRPESDVDLMATFAQNPGLRFFAMEEEMTEILGAPVHLFTRDAVENMTNPFRRASILEDARVIYQA